MIISSPFPPRGDLKEVQYIPRQSTNGGRSGGRGVGDTWGGGKMGRSWNKGGGRVWGCGKKRVENRETEGKS